MNVVKKLEVVEAKQQEGSSRPESQMIVREESAKKLAEGSPEDSGSLQESNIETRSVSVAGLNDIHNRESPRGK